MLIFDINHLLVSILHQMQRVMKTTISKIRANDPVLCYCMKAQHSMLYQARPKNAAHFCKLKIKLNIKFLRLITYSTLIFIKIRALWKPKSQKKRSNTSALNYCAKMQSDVIYPMRAKSNVYFCKSKTNLNIIFLRLITYLLLFFIECKALWKLQSKEAEPTFLYHMTA